MGLKSLSGYHIRWQKIAGYPWQMSLLRGKIYKEKGLNRRVQT